eukprot:13919306-Heterocapsa_arctica.AAC.1
MTKRAFPPTAAKVQSKAEEKAKEVAFRPFRLAIWQGMQLTASTDEENMAANKTIKEGDLKEGGATQ